jgi:hypothetical protein
MEIGVPNSFIPHDATTPDAPHYERSGGLAELLFLVALVLLIVSIALCAGTYIYMKYLQSESTQKQAQIKAAQAAFDPQLIEQLTRLDNRMTSADTILGTHIAPSAFFAALDSTTLTTVSFQSLTFDATNPSAMTLDMSGIAHDVNSIALQADLFSKSGIITNPIFAGIDQQADGVHFTVKASVNPSALSYESLVTGQTPAGVTPLPSSSAVSSSSTAPSTSAPASAFNGAGSGSAQGSASSSATQ